MVDKCLWRMIVWLTFILNCADCAEPEHPHIIVIVADDLGWNDVSFHGSNQIPTPNIDKLASEGILLNNYYVSPICTPTRGALMTGRHPIHTGLQSGVIVGSQPYGLPLSEKILPQWLGELGYQNHMVGKWHLGMFADDYLPTRRGFLSHYGYLQGAEGYFDHTYAVSNDGEWGLDWRRNDDIIRNEREMYSTELFTKEAVKHIEQHNKSQPLFLYIAHQAVHRGNFDDPLLAPQKYVDRFPHIHNYKRKLFAGMVAALDDSVGIVIGALKAQGMMDHSVVVFTTDNGGPANGFDDNAANNFPLRGVKTTLWEGGVRGSGLIYSPLLKTSGYTSNHLMHVCDWLPTLYTVAGGDISLLTHSDGFSMWRTLSQNVESPRTELLHNIDPIQNSAALRMGDYKLLVGDVGMTWDGWYPPWQNPDDSGTSEQYDQGTSKQYDQGTSNQYDQGTSKQYNQGTSDQYDQGTSKQYDQGTSKQYDQGTSDQYDQGTSKQYDQGTSKQYDQGTRKQHDQGTSKQYDGSDVTELKFVETIRSNLDKPQTNASRKSSLVKCGEKPLNASTNCNPVKSPCLYNIRLDPCEYHNIAMDNQQVVIEMLLRITGYMYTMVPPGNKDTDPAGDPIYHNQTWVPWIKL